MVTLSIADIHEIQSILGKTRTESMPPDLILSYFYPFPAYNMMFNEDTALIEGGRGTGKSMLLHYFYLNARNISKDNGENITIPILIRFSPFHFSHFQRNRYKRKENCFYSFLTVFNLSVNEILWYSLLEYNPSNSHSINVQEIMKDGFKDLLLNYNLKNSWVEGIRNINDLVSLFKNAKLEMLNFFKNLIQEGEKYDDNDRFRDFVLIASDPNFLLDEFSFLSKSLFPDHTTKFYLLIDEYDKFTPEQQSMINTIINQRTRNLTFKVACKSGWFNYNSFIGPRLEVGNDLNWFPTNLMIEASKASTVSIRNFLEEMVNQRFRTKFEGFSIRDVLGTSPSDKERIEKVRTHGPGASPFTYFGARDVANMASGIARLYLNISNQIITEALSQGHIIDLKNITPISKEIQNKVIRGISRQELFRIFKSEMGNEIQLFTENITQAFKVRMNYNIKANFKYAATFSFAIRDFIDLDPDIQNFLSHLEKESIIFHLNRRGKDGLYMHRVYSLANKFAPAYNLIPTNPDPAQFFPSEFSKILEEKNEFSKILKKKWDIKNIKTDEKNGNNLDLTSYFEEDE